MTGWEKVWRAACWAQLGEGDRFYNVFKVCTRIPARAYTVLTYRCTSVRRLRELRLQPLQPLRPLFLRRNLPD